MNTNIDQFGWSEDLESGIEVLDAQHKKYLELVARSTTVGAEALELAETLGRSK